MFSNYIIFLKKNLMEMIKESIFQHTSYTSVKGHTIKL